MPILRRSAVVAGVLLLGGVGSAQAVVPAFEGTATTAQNGNAGASDALVLPVPTGAVAGEMLLATLAVNEGNKAVITAPGGWQLIERTNAPSTDTGVAIALATYRRTATGSEPVSYTWSLATGAGNKARAAGGMMRLSGVRTGVPQAISVARGTGTAVSIPGVVTAVDNQMLVALIAQQDNAAFSAWSSPLTERFDIPNPDNAGPVAAGATGVQAGAGASGPKGATSTLVTPPPNPGEWAGQLIALQPKLDQAAVTVTATSPAVYGSTQTLVGGGGSGTGTYSFGASGTACSLSGATLTITAGSGTCSVSATRAGDDDYMPATSPSETVTVGVAATSTSSAPSTTSVGTGVEFHLDYTVQSAFGIAGQTAGGSVSAVTSGAGLGCSASAVAMSNAQGASGWTFTADGLTNTASRISCVPTAPGIYTVRAAYSGDANYAASQGTDASTTVGSTVTVCPAAPSIAAAWLKANGHKPGTKRFTNILSTIAREMTPGAGFGGYAPCDSDYEDTVELRAAALTIQRG